jgi:hypothetical protein
MSESDGDNRKSVEVNPYIIYFEYDEEEEEAARRREREDEEAAAKKKKLEKEARRRDEEWQKNFDDWVWESDDD